MLPYQPKEDASLPFKESAFWLGITLGGTGLFFWIEDEHLIPAIIITFVGVIGVAYSIWSHHHPDGKTVPLWAVLMFITWAFIGYDLYSRTNSHRIPEFDSPQSTMVEGYGLDTPSSCFLTVDGRALASLRGHYKLAVGCFIYDGNEDILDAPNVQVGNLYDITDGTVYLRATWGDQFNAYRIQHHARGIDVALLAIPNGVQPTQFDTLREARSLGVRIPSLSIALAGQLVPNPSPQVRR